MLAILVIVVIGLVILAASVGPEPAMTLALSSIAFGYACAWMIPVWYKRDHVKAQNALLDRCRVLLVLGSRAIDDGQRDSAERLLARIRRLESLWHYGSSAQFRITLALWAIGCAVVASILIRFLCLLASSEMKGGDATAINIPQELWLSVLLSLSAPLHAMLSYFSEWENPDAIRNCGDRLWDMLHGAKGLASAPKRSKSNAPRFGGLSATQMFGLGSYYTRKELDKARRHLARALHPDLFHMASAEERAEREDQMKHVNAAYDLLLKGAR